MSSRGGSLPRYIAQRVLLMIPMLWVLLTVVFLVMRVAPGDPVSAALGAQLPEEELERRREALGFNDPLYVQYWRYLSGVLQLDFGSTITDNQPILDVIKENGGATLSLSIAALLVALVIGLPLGMLAGRFRDRAPDAVIRLFGILTYATPIFYLGILFQLLFAVKLDWLPVNKAISVLTEADIPERTHILLIDAILSGNSEALADVVLHLIMPAFTLGLLICGILIRLVRVNLLQTMQGDYVEAARARGVKEGKVMRSHAFRNALVPVVTVIGLQIALLLGGAVLTESTFEWPGLGTRLVEYIEGRDYTGVQGIITLFGVVVVVISMLIDIVNALIDPRVRY